MTKTSGRENEFAKSDFSRRTALKMGAAGTCAAISNPISLNAASTDSSELAQWNKIIGQKLAVLRKSFVVESFVKPTSLRLVEASGVGTKSQDGRSLPTGVAPVSISLCFESDRATVLESASYEISHPKTGIRNLFINELFTEPDSPVRIYESILS